VPHDLLSRRRCISVGPPHPSPFRARVEAIELEDRALLAVLVLTAVLMLASESLWALVPGF
jgi:hypothetical protein